MAKDFRYPDRDQSFLLPPDMRDWLASDHLVWWLIDVVDSLDVTAFEATSRLGGAGRAPYAPRTLLGVLIYGYANGQRSSRQLERLCGVDVGFRILAGNATGTDAPDHSTLARFRQRHDQALEGLFTQVLVLCAKAGLGKLGMIAIDGTKIAANAAMDANSSQSRLREKYAAEVAKIMAEAEEVDAAEDELFGDARGDEVPPSWSGRQGRKARIRAALDDIAAEQAAQADAAAAAATPTAEQQHKAQDYERVMTDPTVTPQQRHRRGAPGKGTDRILLARAAVERQLQLARDRHLALQRNAEAAALQGRKIIGPKPKMPEEQCHVRRVQARLDALLAADHKPARPAAATVEGKNIKRNISDPDSRVMKTQKGWVQGYNCQLAVADDQLILAVRATQDGNDSRQFVPMMTAAQHAADLIVANRPTPTSEQASGQVGEQVGVIVADAGYLSIDNLTAAGPDRLIALGKGHALHRDAQQHPAYGEPPADAAPLERMGHRLRTAAGAALYKRRGVTVEPVNGHLKDRHDLRTFSRRGQSAVNAELNLAAAIANLMKLYKSQTAPA